MSINIKKYTKEQMVKMVEEAQEKTAALEAEVTDLHEQLAISNKAAIAASEEYQENTAKLRGRIAEHIDTISQMNGELINKANEIINKSHEIANLKADADALRNKLADTEAALGRANAEVSYSVTEKNELNAKIKQLDGNLHYHKIRSDELDHYKNLLSNANEAQAQIRDNLAKAHWERDAAQERANYAEAHPWRNLWAWIKRKLKTA